MRHLKKVIYLRESSDGHRAEYERLFVDIFSRSGIECTVASLSLNNIFSTGVLFSSMLEEHPLRLLLTALFRAVFGLKTVSISFRSVQALESKSLRLAIKRWLLRLSKRFSCISILSLIPFDTDDELASICRYYIYDPQLWDLLYYRDAPDLQLMAEIVSISGGRKILCAIGRQDIEKGFDAFSQLWINNPVIRKSWLFVSGGAVDDSVAPLTCALQDEGAYIINRRISNAEIMALYNASDAIWCCYHPAYDQASGIFGRAFQLNKLPIVRSGSFLESFAEKLGIDVIPFDETAYVCSYETIFTNKDGPTCKSKIRSSEDLRAYSMSILSLALGFEIS